MGSYKFSTGCLQLAPQGSVLAVGSLEFSQGCLQLAAQGSVPAVGSFAPLYRQDVQNCRMPVSWLIICVHDIASAFVCVPFMHEQELYFGSGCSLPLKLFL